MAEKPELKPVVEKTLQDLQRQWEELEGTTQTKAQCLFDANRAELFTQSCSALDVWLKNLEGQLQSDEYGKDLTSVNILLKKHQVDLTVQGKHIKNVPDFKFVAKFCDTKGFHLQNSFHVKGIVICLSCVDVVKWI